MGPVSTTAQLVVPAATVTLAASSTMSASAAPRDKVPEESKPTVLQLPGRN